jgi:hypothetical protein
MDNSYGKISAVYHDYLQLFESVRFASSVDEANNIIDEYMEEINT